MFARYRLLGQIFCFSYQYLNDVTPLFSGFHVSDKKSVSICIFFVSSVSFFFAFLFQFQWGFFVCVYFKVLIQIVQYLENFWCGSTDRFISDNEEFFLFCGLSLYVFECRTKCIEEFRGKNKQYLHKGHTFFVVVQAIMIHC